VSHSCGNSCTQTCNDSCGRHSCGLLTRLRERFHRNDCCDGGCNNGCGGGVTYGPGGTIVPPPVKGGEKIDVPGKKLPPNEGGDKKNGQVYMNPNTLTPGTIQSNTPPAVEITPVPVPVPRVEGDRRDPF